MKILISIDSLQAGGAEKSTLDMIPHLAAHWDITVVYFYDKHDLKPAFLAAPCKLLYIPLHSGYKFNRGIKQLIALIKAEKFNLILTTLYRSGIMCRIAGKLTNTPVVDTIVNDGYSAAKLAEFKGLHKLKFYSVKWLDKITAGIPVQWISNSAAIAQSMGKSLGLRNNRVNVIFRGRETQQMRAWHPPAEGEAFHFVAAGRLVAQKGFSDLVNAFALLYQHNKCSRLTIYGEGKDRTLLQQQINDLDMGNVVKLPGRVPDVWKQFYQAHCFVLPSYYEGLSGVLIEALITGIPVIASDISMNKEASVHESSILFFQKGNVNELYQALNGVVENYCEVKSQSHLTRQLAIEQYDLANIFHQYHKVLLKAAKA